MNFFTDFFVSVLSIVKANGFFILYGVPIPIKLIFCFFARSNERNTSFSVASEPNAFPSETIIKYLLVDLLSLFRIFTAISIASEIIDNP